MTAIALQVSYVVGGGAAEPTLTRLTLALERAGAETADVAKHVLPRLAKVLEKGTQQQFTSEGSGPQAGSWAPLSASYAQWKEANYPGQPLLVRTEAMRAALTDASAPGALRNISGDALTFGTTGVPYASFHQMGAGRLPARPVFDFGTSTEEALQKALAAGVRAAVREGSEGLLDFEGDTYTDEEGNSFAVQTGAGGGRFFESGGRRVYLKRTKAGAVVKRSFGRKRT